MQLDPKETAVVLIEYQNDFTSEGGALHGAVQDVMASTGMLNNTVEAVKQARDAGATVIHAPIAFAEGYGEINPEPYGILKGVVDSNASYRNASENFKFSAAVAEFGMLLRDSRYKGQSSYDGAAELARAATGADLRGYRTEFVKLVETAKGLSARGAAN